MANFKVVSGSNADEFIQYLNRVEHGFVYMIETMKDVAEVVRENTLPKTPFETGRLGRSFKWTVVTDNSRMKVLQVQMSALNPNTGYDYAWIQHENSHYKHFKDLGRESRGTLGDKIRKAHGWSGSSKYTGHDATMWYLKFGIFESKEGAFQLIEDDYLSLFKRGFIY